MTPEDKLQLDKLWVTHKKLRSCMLGQPWQVKKDLEQKKLLVEQEMRKIVERNTAL